MSKRRGRQIQAEDCEETSLIRPKLSAVADSGSNPCTREDIISKLPDEILTLILSFIPTKSAVATSALSKRWNQVWISVPNLDFGKYCTSLYRYPVKNAQFLNFVDRVLSLNKVLSVRKIHFDDREERESSRVNTWIDAFAKRDADEIYLRLPQPYTDRCSMYPLINPLPDHFFNQKNLVNLHLENVVLKVPSLVCFPCLEKISLESVELFDEESSRNLLSGCPVLRKLYIGQPQLDDAEILYVCSSSLYCLELNSGGFSRYSSYNVFIHAPNLSELQMVGVVCEIMDISSLEKAVLHDGNVLDDYAEMLLELLKSIAHVKELIITPGVMSCFEEETFENLPLFNNLTSLKMKIDGEVCWRYLSYLLHSMPKLVTFKVELNNSHPYCAWGEPYEVPNCLLSCIENVEISCFQECDEEMEMVNYILKNGMVLKKLELLTFNLDFVKRRNIRNTLVAFPRGSCVCEIKVTDPDAARNAFYERWSKFARSLGKSLTKLKPDMLAEYNEFKSRASESGFVVSASSTDSESEDESRPSGVGTHEEASTSRARALDAPLSTNDYDTGFGCPDPRCFDTGHYVTSSSTAVQPPLEAELRGVDDLHIGLSAQDELIEEDLAARNEL